MDISKLTIKEAKTALESKQISCVELTQHYLNRIEEMNPEINAVLAVDETAIDQARVMDERRARGEDVGVLGGVPMLIKDCIMVQGWENTAGSLILEGHKSAYNATVIDRLRSAGAIFLGRTNMDEFAMGSSTESSHWGPTKNPWDTTKIPGGSSGGSAAAVAGGFAPCALGSDTGGSVRQPASMCGIVGLKPTYGRVSRYGLMSLASSLDQIGPFARTVEDVSLIMQVIEGADPKDATSVNLPSTTAPELLETDLAGIKLGIPKEYFLEGMDEQVKKTVLDAVDVLTRAGAEIQEVSLPHAEYALAAYYIIMPAEASSNLGRYDGMRFGYSSEGTNLWETYEHSRGEGFGSEAKRRIMLGSYTLSAGYVDAYYRKALKVRTLIKQDFEQAFKHVSAIVTPTSPTTAWNIGEKFNDPLTMYLSDIYTITANLATIPALSLPCGFVNGLPVGLQLMGRAFDEHLLYRIGSVYQKVVSS